MTDREALARVRGALGALSGSGYHEGILAGLLTLIDAQLAEKPPKRTLTPSIFASKELRSGEYYAGVSRNLSVARWIDGRFYGWRQKFGSEFLVSLPHEEDQAGFDFFVPVRFLMAHQVREVPMNAPASAAHDG